MRRNIEKFQKKRKGKTIGNNHYPGHRFIKEQQLTNLMITHNMSHAIAYGSRLLMMDAGEIIIDASGEGKARLTVPKLLAIFADIRKKDLENDGMLLPL